jgi:hypothetical protein
MPVPDPVLHSDQSGENLHANIWRVFSTVTALNASGVYALADIHKFAYVSENQTTYNLIEVTSPGSSATPTWKALGGGSLSINESGETGDEVTSIEIEGAAVSFPSPGNALLQIQPSVRQRIPVASETFAWLCADEVGDSGGFADGGSAGVPLTGDSENLAVRSQRAGWIAPRCIEGRGSANFLQGGASFSTLSFAVEAWFKLKPSSPSGLNFFLKLPSSHASGYAIALGFNPSGPSIVGNVSRTAGTGGGTVSCAAPNAAGTDSAWHHVGLVRIESSGLFLYLDGDLVDQEDFSGTVDAVGAGNWRVAENCSAHLQDIRIQGSGKNAEYFRSVWLAGMLIPTT